MEGVRERRKHLFKKLSEGLQVRGLLPVLMLGLQKIIDFCFLSDFLQDTERPDKSIFSDSSCNCGPKRERESMLVNRFVSNFA